MGKKRGLLILILLCILFIYLRGALINADVPHDISFSGGIFSDEGDYSINARNRVLYGSWFMDQWNDMYYNPSLTFIRYIFFCLFDVGIAQQRWISILFSMLSIFLVYLTLSEDFNRRTAVLGILFFGFNYLYIMYSRNGLLEVPTIALSTFFIYCFQKGFKKPRFFMYAGAFTIFTYSFKNLFAYMLPVTIVAYIFYVLINSVEYKKHIKPVILLTGGYLASFLAWYFLHFRPLRGWIIGYAGEYMKELLLAKSLGHVLYNFKTFPVTKFYGPLTNPVNGVFLSMPVIYALGFVFVGVFLYLILFNKKLIRPTDVMTVSYFFAAFLFVLLILAYRPTRYFIVLIVPLSIMSARLIDLILKLRLLKPAVLNIKGIIFISVIYIWGFVFYYLCIMPFYCHIFSRSINESGIPLKISLVKWTLIYFAATGFIIIISYIRNKPLWISRYAVAAASLAIIISSVLINLYHYSKWYRSPSYDVYNSAMTVKEIVPEGSVMAGLISPVLVMESNIRPFFMFQGFMNYENDPCIRNGVTHAVLGIYNNEAGIFFDTCPEKMGKSTLIRVLNIFRKDFMLYSFVLPVLREVSLIRSSPESIECELRLYIPSEKFCDNLTVNVYLIKESGRTEIDPLVFSGLIPFEENTVHATLPFGTQNKSNMEFFFCIDNEEAGLSMEFKASSLLKLTGSDHYDKTIFHDDVRKGVRISDKQGFLTYGPYLPLEEGMATVNFFISPFDLPESDTDAFVVDIAGDTGKTILSSKNIRTSELKEHENAIFEVPLGFFLKKRTRIEFRTYFFSTVSIYVHKIRLDFKSGRFLRVEA